MIYYELFFLKKLVHQYFFLIYVQDTRKKKESGYFYKFFLSESNDLSTISLNGEKVLYRNIIISSILLIMDTAQIVN